MPVTTVHCGSSDDNYKVTAGDQTGKFDVVTSRNYTLNLNVTRGEKYIIMKLYKMIKILSKS